MTTMAPALSKTSGEDSEGSPDRKEGGAGCHAPSQPALMICERAGECRRVRDCLRKEPHQRVTGCALNEARNHPAGCPFPKSVCVQWVEPVKHTSCDGCVHKGINFFMCGGCFNQMETMSNQEHRNYTPKEPEPAVPVMGVCEQCGAFTFDKDAAMCPCGGFILFPKEPEAEPVEAYNTVGECFYCANKSSCTFEFACDCIKWQEGNGWKHTRFVNEPKAEPGLVERIEALEREVRRLNNPAK